MRPCNDLSQALLLELQTSRWNDRVVAGFWFGPPYCVGVRVNDVADAFALGTLLGHRFGQPEWFSWPKWRTSAILVFRQAWVQA